jgi:enoyl-CoA hydratase
MAVKYEIEGGVAVITLDRPEARNAVDGNTALAVERSIRDMEADESVRACVITGAGGNFCAGMDLRAFLRGEIVRLPGTGFAGVTQAKLTKPLVAAVEGYALAGGMEIALACDLLIAADGAKFGLPEVKRGLVANAGGLVRLPRQLPPKIACEFVLTGDIYGAEILAQHGLINRIVPNGQALAAALEMAHKIAANGPLAVAVSKQVMMESVDWPSTELFDRQNAITAAVFASEDAQEGARAFAEKRTPVWRGR